MKANQTCPKCGGRRFIVNERVGFSQKQYKGQDRYVAPLPVIARVQSNPGVLFGTSTDVQELGTYESWSCVGCGYTELYAADLDRLLTEGAGRVVG